MNSPPSIDHFLCSIDDVNTRIRNIDPRVYDKTRNYLDGGVTWLSPFTTHGITTTKHIAELVLENHKPKSCYRLLFELGWREFFHRTWQLAGEEIFDDMRNTQAGVRSEQLPAAIANASTGINTIDECLQHLKSDGLMHNHARMWIAGMSCNMAGTHWHEPARWLHYHLLDGDLASNTLSWQWIAGTFSHKQYVANQGNIDKYSKTAQTGSWLDVPYEAFDNFKAPEHLLERCDEPYNTSLPGEPIKSLNDDVALRSIWNLNPDWQNDIDNHVIFIDEELARLWPMSERRWAFIEHWARQCNARIYYGTVNQLKEACLQARLVRQEYPACEQWPGEVQDRDWLYPMPDKSFNSFSQYFKQVKHHAGL